MRIGVIGIPGLWSSERLADAAAERTGRRLLVDPAHIEVDLAAREAFAQGVALHELDLLLVKKIGPSYSPHLLDRLEPLRLLEDRGVAVRSRPLRILRVLDRLACTVSLRQAEIPIPPTVVTEDLDAAERAVARFGRAVLKPLFTSKARGMLTLAAGPSTRGELAAFQAAGNPVLYIQKLLDHPGRDLGITFLGGAYVATYARVGRRGSWNTSTSSGGVYAAHEPSPELVELARRAQEPFGLDFTCVDVMETAAGPAVLEVSAFGGFRGLREAHGLDAAALLVDYALRSVP